MAETEQPEVFVHFLPSLIPHGALKGGVAVVVDVLRATTAMVHALAAGCEAVIPCGEIDEARCVAEEFRPGRRSSRGSGKGCPSRGSTSATPPVRSPPRSVVARPWS